MANLNGFNANDHEPNGVFTPIPEGNYIAAIVASEMKPTKNGNGSYLELKFQITDGEYKGRTLFSRLNLNNKNETAVKIARGDLSAICRAVNVMKPKDSLELHNLPLEIVVKCVKRKDNDELTNEIKGYQKKGASSSPQPANASASDAPPWG